MISTVLLTSSCPNAGVLMHHGVETCRDLFLSFLTSSLSRVMTYFNPAAVVSSTKALERVRGIASGDKLSSTSSASEGVWFGDTVLEGEAKLWECGVEGVAEVWVYVLGGVADPWGRGLGGVAGGCRRGLGGVAVP